MNRRISTLLAVSTTVGVLLLAAHPAVAEPQDGQGGTVTSASPQSPPTPEESSAPELSTSPAPTPLIEESGPAPAPGANAPNTEEGPEASGEPRSDPAEPPPGETDSADDTSAENTAAEAAEDKEPTDGFAPGDGEAPGLPGASEPPESHPASEVKTRSTETAATADATPFDEFGDADPALTPLPLMPPNNETWTNVDWVFSAQDNFMLWELENLGPLNLHQGYNKVNSEIRRLAQDDDDAALTDYIVNKFGHDYAYAGWAMALRWDHDLEYGAIPLYRGVENPVPRPPPPWEEPYPVEPAEPSVPPEPAEDVVRVPSTPALTPAPSVPVRMEPVSGDELAATGSGGAGGAAGLGTAFVLAGTSLVLWASRRRYSRDVS